MKYSYVLTAWAFTSLASSSTVPDTDARVVSPNAAHTRKRASGEAPNGYKPAKVDCPSTRPSIRSADRLSDAETQWLGKRRPNTVDPMREFLVRANIPGFDAGQYIDTHRLNTSALPNIALAFSGGGYRALLNGAGVLSAFDSRTPNATSPGHLGGLLQASTYISALSGGGWMIGSIYANNFISVQKLLQDRKDIWQFQHSLYSGPKSTLPLNIDKAGYWLNLKSTVDDKKEGKFDISLTDYYGRALSYQLISDTDGAPGYTFSSIQDDKDFSDGQAPMPIIVADERAPGKKIISLKSTVFEFNPFEMGSFDPTVYGFAPLKYIGSKFSNGELPQDKDCIAGFDNLGFVMGTSSSLFNLVGDNVEELKDNGPVKKMLKSVAKQVAKRLGKNNNDIADYSPNPFLGFHKDTNPNSKDKRLTLVDGGEDLQNVPLHPVLQPMRNVDVIFAVDSSADTVDKGHASPNWPNGTALIATYHRANTDIMNKTTFPYVPGEDTFVALGLNNRPTFFGCDSKNVTKGNNIPPLIVYMPNSPYVFWSNTSTFDKLAYSTAERDAMIQNGYNVATQANSTRLGASTWPTCVACAVLSRSLERNGQMIPQACQQCFTQYCWNGTVVEKSEPYKPEMILPPIEPYPDPPK